MKGTLLAEVKMCFYYFDQSYKESIILRSIRIETELGIVSPTVQFDPHSVRNSISIKPSNVFGPAMCLVVMMSIWDNRGWIKLFLKSV